MYKLFIILSLVSTSIYAEIITPIKKVESYNVGKVALGKQLFFDKKLSKDGTISCASCHSDFGSDSRVVSIGVNGQKGAIQSLSVFNAVNNYKQFWNARAPSLNSQMDSPIHSAVEMGNSIENIEQYLKSSKIYNKLFKDVFSKKPSYLLLKDAIVAFEKTLVTPNSHFDRFLEGKESLTRLEKKGFYLFKNYGCAACHNGVNVGGNSMQMIGNVVEYPYIKGQSDLYSITNKEVDKNVFRVPSLRNITKTAPYFHDGSVKTIEGAVGKMAYYNLGMVLEDTDIKAIVSFLKTLEGEVPTTWSSNVR